MRPSHIDTFLICVYALIITMDTGEGQKMFLRLRCFYARFHDDKNCRDNEFYNDLKREV